MNPFKDNACPLSATFCIKMYFQYIRPLTVMVPQ